MWSVVERVVRLGVRCGAVLLLCAAGACGNEAAGDLEAAPTIGRSSQGRQGEGGALLRTPEAPADVTPRPGTSESQRIRRGGQGPESILEFGLFGPVVPTLESEGYYQSDCRFENDPYETCL
ncbi:MAG: hypothetical protein R3244_03385 [Thermoanaerobaculia bacterium]|nr:hypothetical protein [Thermoanaerobaculia bacterium]